METEEEKGEPTTNRDTETHKEEGMERYCERYVGERDIILLVIEGKEKLKRY